MQFSLSDLPAAIYAQQMKINRCDDLIGELKQILTTAEVEVDLAIAADADLKNDTQRKAKRASVLLEHKAYQVQLAELGKVTRDRADTLATLELYRNTLSVKKLEARLAIASQLAGLESAELLGV